MIMALEELRERGWWEGKGADDRGSLCLAKPQSMTMNGQLVTDNISKRLSNKNFQTPSDLVLYKALGCVKF